MHDPLLQLHQFDVQLLQLARVGLVGDFFVAGSLAGLAPRLLRVLDLGLGRLRPRRLRASSACASSLPCSSPSSRSKLNAAGAGYLHACQASAVSLGRRITVPSPRPRRRVEATAQRQVQVDALRQALGLHAQQRRARAEPARAGAARPTRRSTLPTRYWICASSSARSLSATFAARIASRSRSAFSAASAPSTSPNARWPVRA